MSPTGIRQRFPELEQRGGGRPSRRLSLEAGTRIAVHPARLANGRSASRVVPSGSSGFRCSCSMLSWVRRSPDPTEVVAPCNAFPGAMGSRSNARHDQDQASGLGGLRKIHLPRDGLHLFIGELAGIAHDRRWIAREWPVGKGIVLGDRESAAHVVSVPAEKKVALAGIGPDALRFPPVAIRTKAETLSSPLSRIRGRRKGIDPQRARQDEADLSPLSFSSYRTGGRTARGPRRARRHDFDRGG